MKNQTFAFMSKKKSGLFKSRIRKELKIEPCNIDIRKDVFGLYLVDVYWDKNLTDTLANLFSIYVEINCPGYFVAS